MDGGADDHYRGLISSCPHSDAERGKISTWSGSHIRKSWREYSDDPELLQIMRDMHIDSVLRYGPYLQLNP
jgi:hypothetical protein